MLDKHTARALVGLGRMSSREYLRVFGEDLRSGQKQALDAPGNALGKAKTRKAPPTARACAGPQLPRALTQDR